jgi:alpha-glucosidase
MNPLRVVAAFVLGASAIWSPSAAQSLGAEPAAIARLANGIEASRGPVRIEVTALTDSIVRVRIANGPKLSEDASWAVPAARRRESVPVSPSPDGFRTKAIVVRLDPKTLKLSIADLAGKIIVEDAAEPISFHGNGFTLRKAMPQKEHYFAMGDKTGVLDRRGYAFTNWNSDTFGYTPSTDPIYKSIPFFIAAGGEGGAYGLFLDNSWRSTFDFGHREEATLEIGAVDGPIDYYLIAGPDMAQVVRRYSDLTGKAPLAPIWALGYQQSRWSYMSDAEVRSLAARFGKESFPIDVIWLDIDYQDRNRPFTVNGSTFPDMRALVSEMGRKGIRVVPITDLHVPYLPKQGYAPFDTGIASNDFVRKADGQLYVAPVWAGPSVFPDFTSARARTWWGSLYKDFIDEGFAGFWNDMNEPAVFETPTKTMPLDNLHRIESDDFAPRDATHAEIHNVYGMENTRATFEGMLRWRPNLRPFVMTRASFAGGQRYAVTWTGDNSSTWDHLRLSIEQLINLGLSGFSYSGADVGGFTGGPSAELMTRWFEFAAFTPIFRDHSMKDAPRAEPWVDGPRHLAIRRRYVEERYRLLPYIYALAELNSRTGDPIMRPVFYDYPETLGDDCDRSTSFTLGPDLLIAGPPKPESPSPFDICLPAGKWYDYWTGLAASQSKFKQLPRLETLPVFVRGGTILPRQLVTKSTMERPAGPLSLDIYPGEKCTGDLYFDDGVSVKGEYLRQSLSCSVNENGVVLRFGKRQGTWRPWWHRIAVTLHGEKPVRMNIADQPHAAEIALSTGSGR